MPALMITLRYADPNCKAKAERKKKKEDLGKQKLIDLQKFKEEAKKINQQFNKLY